MDMVTPVYSPKLCYGEWGWGGNPPPPFQTALYSTQIQPVPSCFLMTDPCCSAADGIPSIHVLNFVMEKGVGNPPPPKHTHKTKTAPSP